MKNCTRQQAINCIQAKINFISSTFVLLALFILSTACVRAQTVSTTVLNQQYVDGCSTPHTYEIATLAASSGLGYDHLHLVATLGEWQSWTNSTIDATFGNGQAFNVVYSSSGASPLGMVSHLVAYRQSDGTINLYIVLNDCSTASYTVLDNIEETVYASPTDTLSATPPGTLLFDTATTPPATQTDFAGDFTSDGTGIFQGDLYVGGNTDAGTLSNFVVQGNTAPYGVTTAIVNHGATAISGGNGIPYLSIGQVGSGGWGIPYWANAGLIESETTGGLVIGANGNQGEPIVFETNRSPVMMITNNGNVGIGTTTPSVPLEVNGSIKMDSGGIKFSDGSQLNSANSFGSGTSGTSAISVLNGNVGIGTATPTAALSVAGGITATDSLNITNGNDRGNAILVNLPNLAVGNAVSESFGTAFGGSNYFDTALVGFAYAGGAGSTSNYATLSVYAAPSGLIVNGLGRVGIGTASPQALLDVNGGIKISGSGAGLTFPDGSTQSIAYTGACPSTGGDYAESVDIEGDRTSYEPGDVMIIDPDHPGHFLTSSQPYSTLVAGIFSTKPGYVGRRQTTNPKLSTTEIPMAMVGIVPTKATSENGPIKVGDLLVTSSKPGFVMKGTDHNRMTGSIIGKALGSLQSDTGVIEVLVSLQ